MSGAIIVRAGNGKVAYELDGTVSFLADPRQQLEDALRRIVEFIECAACFMDDLPCLNGKADEEPVLRAKTARMLQLQVHEAEKAAEEARALFYRIGPA